MIAGRWLLYDPSRVPGRAFRHGQLAECVLQGNDGKVPMTRYVHVPHDALSDEALAGLIEEFVTREGTDYGLTEHTLAQKSAAVMRQLARGEVLICFDVEGESATLVRSEEFSQAK